MTAEQWTDARLSQALAKTSAPAAAEPERCYHADLFWHLVRGELGKRLTAEMLDHSAGCPHCLQALRLARAVASDAGASAPDPSKGSLQSTLQKFFHPVAALAYLLLLLLSFPVYRLLTPSEPAHPSPVVTGATPQVPLPSVPEGLRGLRLLRLTGDVAFRGGAKQEPARLVLRPEEALALKLFPELEDLPRDPVASLTIRVLEGGKEQASARRRVGDLEADESFLLLLDPGMLQAGKTYRVELRVDSPAPRVVLTQAFRLDAR